MPTPYTEGNGCKYSKIINGGTLVCMGCGPVIEDCPYKGLQTAMYCKNFKPESEEMEKVIKEIRDKAIAAGSYIISPLSRDDPVNHPSHYTAGGIECIDAITAALSCHEDPIAAWLTGQCIKYLWRWPLKNGLEDLKKTQFYLNRLIEHEEKNDD